MNSHSRRLIRHHTTFIEEKIEKLSKCGNRTVIVTTLKPVRDDTKIATDKRHRK